MLTKTEQNLLRFGLDRLVRQSPVPIEDLIPYWLDPPPDIEPMALAVRKIHSSEHLPWPDDRCVIVSPCRIYDDKASALMSSAIQEISFLVRTHGPEADFGQPSELPFVAELDRVQLVGGMHASFSHAGLVATDVCRVTLCRFAFSTTAAMTEAAEMILRRTVDNLRSVMMRQWLPRGHRMDAETSRRVEQWLVTHINIGSLCIPRTGQHAWFSFSQAGFEDAHKELFVLAAKACPCGYKSRAVLPGGYGPKSVRKHTTRKKIFIQSSHDRLYTVCEGADLDLPRAPHARCGHFMYLWKQAGVNRMGLPHDALGRLRIAEQHNVRCVYRRATWVGPRKGTYQEMQWELEEGQEKGNENDAES